MGLNIIDGLTGILLNESPLIELIFFYRCELQRGRLNAVIREESSGFLIFSKEEKASAYFYRLGR